MPEGAPFSRVIESVAIADGVDRPFVGSLFEEEQELGSPLLGISMARAGLVVLHER